MSAVRAIVFDLDDTLYPERQFAFSGYAAVAAAFAERLNRSVADLDNHMGRLFDTPDRGRVFNVILTEAGVGSGFDERLSEMRTWKVRPTSMPAHARHVPGSKLSGIRA